MRRCLLFALLLVMAACSSNSGEDADSLSDILGPEATVAASSTVPTTVADTTTTTSRSPTTTVVSTQVQSAGDTSAQSLQELPLTGGELEIALGALAALLLGVWLIRKANLIELIASRVRSNLFRR